MFATRSNRTKPRDPGHAVEVGIGTGEVSKAVGTHDSDEKRIIVQEAGLLADRGGRIQPRRINRHNADTEKRDFLNGLTKAFQGLHLRRMVPQAQGDPS